MNARRHYHLAVIVRVPYQKQYIRENKERMNKVSSFSKVLVAGIATVSALFSVAGNAVAQTGAAYPDGPITLVVPFAPGGSTDIIGRLVAEKLAIALKQSVVVENRSGAGGNIGAAYVARAKPDGRTLLFGTTGIMSVNEFIYSNPGYSASKDLAPVVYTASISNVLIVNPKLPVKDVAELIALARAKPGMLSFASSGAGSSTHLSGELFKSLADIDILHVPYRGSSQALIDLMGGQIDMTFDNAPSAVPLAQSGKVKALAVTASQPLGVLPGVPTVEAAGLKGYESLSWSGVVAPAGTPADVVDRLNKEVNIILADESVKKRLNDLGAQGVGGSVEAFKAHIASETAKWGKLVTKANIKSS